MFNQLRYRLMALFLAIYLVCLIGLGVFAMQSFSALTKVTSGFKSAVAEASHLAKFQDSVWALRWGFAQYIALGDGNPGRAKILADDPILHAAALKALQDYGSSQLIPEERKGLEGLQVAFKQYYESRAPWFKLVEEGKKEDATEWRAKNTTPFGAATVKALLDQFALQQIAADGSFEAAAHVKERLSMLLVAIFVILLLPIYMISSQARKISTHIIGATQGALAVASGDLSQTIPAGSADEVGQLLTALQKMQGSLQRLVGQVRESSGSIQVASAEVASGTEDLSQRTEQTAASLEQAASSMEELSGTVEQSATSAKRASQLASSAAQVAARGGEVVGQVVNTMEDIAMASRKISDIISVIDGIAFQTNILALNAAVEAARAGEQGRGFAVVASEVRSLAGRSAEAAREIKALIGASVDKVEVGTRLVSEAGQTMGEIVTSVQQVAHMIEDISAAASEQAKGITQVTQNVSQLDQMTQQNAALVEQSMAAAASLRDQAERMSEVVSTFTLPSGSGQKMISQAAVLSLRSAPQSMTKTASPASAKPKRPALQALPASKSPSPRQPAQPETEQWETF